MLRSVTVEELLAVAGSRRPARWDGRRGAPERAPGVYLVTCTGEVEADGERVQAGEIVYVGKAASPRGGLRQRLSQYSRQTLERGSHWGGVRVLHIPAEARRVYWAVCHDPRDAERAMLVAFVARHGRRPFANRSA